MVSHDKSNHKKHIDNLLNLIAKEGIVSVCHSENLNKSDISLLKLIASFGDSSDESRNALKILNERHPATTIQSNKVYTIQGTVSVISNS